MSGCYSKERAAFKKSLHFSGCQGGHEDAEEAAEDAGNAVEAQHAAGVVQPAEHMKGLHEPRVRLFP